MQTNNENEPIEVFAGTSWQAEMVKSLLESAEIETFLKDGIVGTLAPWWTAPGGAGSVSVFVSANNFDEAMQIVSEYEKNLKEE